MSYCLSLGVLEQQCHYAIVSHARMVVCVMTFGPTIFASAKSLLLEKTVTKV